MAMNLPLRTVFAAVVSLATVMSPALANAQGTTVLSAKDNHPLPPKNEKDTTDGYYAESSSSSSSSSDDAFTNYSALGETPGPGSVAGSRAFIYVNGEGLHANYAQVGWRGYFNPKEPIPSNICNGSFDIQWTDAQGNHQERHGSTPSCTTAPQFNFPGHYLSFDLNNDTFKANTDVCGRYTIQGETSPWACVTMKP